MQSRVTTAERYAIGDRTSPSGARQRTNASCVTSSASMTLPSILYAIENSKGRYWSYACHRTPLLPSRLRLSSASKDETNGATAL